MPSEVLDGDIIVVGIIRLKEQVQSKWMVAQIFQNETKKKEAKLPPVVCQCPRGREADICGMYYPLKSQHVVRGKLSDSGA